MVKSLKLKAEWGLGGAGAGVIRGRMSCGGTAVTPFSSATKEQKYNILVLIVKYKLVSGVVSGS